MKYHSSRNEVAVISLSPKGRKVQVSRSSNLKITKFHCIASLLQVTNCVTSV